MATAPCVTASVSPREPDINKFVLENGRLPRMGDATAPWDYRGWLLWYCQLAHGHPDIVDRWGYYHRTLEAGHLLDEPIPQVSFTDYCDSAGLNMLQKALDFIYHEAGSWSAFPQMIDWIAWGMAVSNSQPEFSPKLNERLYRHFDLSPLLLKPHDYLGTLYADGKGRWNPQAFFPTPHSVVECMVQMTLNNGGPKRSKEEQDPRTLTICDPAVGSGRMLLHASNHGFCLYGADIDAVCCRITAINGALYAPWLSFPFSETVLGTTLPPPPPARLPISEQYRSEKETQYRVDDRGQGLLFDSN